jgi:hypothetical protein
MMTTKRTTISIWIKFAGWFQCRLATDPDPADEPRGVDGYIHAVAGEPDLDRIIRLQPSANGSIQRSYCPTIGVRVVSVYVGQNKEDNHPLIGGVVNFLNNPKFEGRNTILAEAGEEAVFPMHIQVKKKDKCLIQRRFDDKMKFPPTDQVDLDKFKMLQANGININPGAVGEATGIFDLASIWEERIVKLKADITKTNKEIEIAAMRSRIESMSNMRNTRRFSARMLYSMSLTGNAIFKDKGNYFPGKPIGLDPNNPWTLEFWCGAWDADAISGYIVGYLGIPISARRRKSQVYDALPLIKDLEQMINNPSIQRI